MTSSPSRSMPSSIAQPVSRCNARVTSSAISSVNPSGPRWPTMPGGGPAPAGSRYLILALASSLSPRSEAGVRSGHEGQGLADGAFPPVGYWQRQVCLDLAAVAAAVFLRDHVAGLGQVGGKRRWRCAR